MQEYAAEQQKAAVDDQGVVLEAGELERNDREQGCAGDRSVDAGRTAEYAGGKEPHRGAESERTRGHKAVDMSEERARETGRYGAQDVRLDLQPVDIDSQRLGERP